ncbi:PRC-barrel domain protein [Methanobrevibacter cuticularis]|uniref:PRC-barrel domain protein n=1 Tax=Methanobrevibacter cuticularis TaxID=47311 RepID=A0A166CLL9_9EURY|nr:PRC-barrel domain-containing protein [Methanobrevibacter cuticularis]KZX14639.1 PRC-barrel domain protein [Methanobrevibacter cuticularis]
MKATDLIGMVVIDKEGHSTGVIRNIEVDEQNGKIEGVDVHLKEGFCCDEGLIKLNQIDNISNVVALNIMIDKL